MLIDMRSTINWPTLPAIAAWSCRWVVGPALLGPAAVGAVIALDPARVGLSTTPLVLHALSFRGLLAVGQTAVGGTILTVAARSGCRPWRAVAAGVVLLATGFAQGSILVRRGWATPPRSGRADLVVVSLNTLGGQATPRQIAALVSNELVRAAAAVVALPETTGTLAERTAGILAESGHRFQVFSSPVGRRTLDTTSLLVHQNLGPYRQLPGPKMRLGAVLVEPVEGPGPTLAAVHPSAPAPPVYYWRWRTEVREAVLLAGRHPVSVVAGDFNTTVDHRMMRDLGPVVDAATRAGRGAEGTWPAHLPAALAAPLDHVLLNGPFEVLGTRTVRVGRSDHRAVIARLIRSDGPSEPAPDRAG